MYACACMYMCVYKCTSPHYLLLDGIRTAQLCVIAPILLSTKEDSPLAQLAGAWAFETGGFGSIPDEVLNSPVVCDTVTML